MLIYIIIYKVLVIIFLLSLVISKEGRTKGNIDGELILAMARDFYENKLENAVLVSGDGDYHCIVEF